MSEKQNGTYEKYMVPNMDDETLRVMFNKAQRTITEDHV